MDSSFPMPKILAEFQQGHPPWRQIEVGVCSNGSFWPTPRYISEALQDRDRVTMECS